MRFNAWLFGRAWNSVALAQGADRSRPGLYRTTLIELYPSGVRLISTDGFILLKAWIAEADSPDAPEPNYDELPDEVAICADVDAQVVALMKYAQNKTKQDGADTDVEIEMRLGNVIEGEQGTLQGLTQTSVSFRFDNTYDQSIDTPTYDGAFPNWRPLWFSHRWTQTGLVSFGADGILRLGKLSQLWDRAAIRFELGGSLGVSKVHILAPGVNVSGLAMPVRDSREDESVTAITPLPPSTEGIDHEYGDALDDFLADILRAEDTDHAVGDEMIGHAQRAQVLRAGHVVVAEGTASAKVLIESLHVSESRALELLEALVLVDVIRLVDAGLDADDVHARKYDVADGAAELLDALGAVIDDDTDDGGGEPV